MFHYEDEVTIRLDFAEERSVVYETLARVYRLFFVTYCACGG